MHCFPLVLLYCDVGECYCTQDTDVDSGSQVVNIGDKNELLAIFDELRQETRVVQALIDVTMARWVPTVKHNKATIQYLASITYTSHIQD